MAACFHVRKAQTGHQHQRLAVEIDHAAFILQGYLVICAEFSETGRVDQQSDVGLFDFQKFLNSVEAFRRAQIQRQWPHGDGNFLFQRFQRIQPAGNDPDFIHFNIFR